jgi:hypothetical protein
MLKEQIPQQLLDTIGIERERDTEIPTVHWCLFSGMEILDRRDDWNGQYIPIIPFLGDDSIIDGRRVLSGIVRGAMEPSMQYNYFRSMMTETIGLAPKAPYIMAAGQNEGFEKMWDTANTENFSTLYYKPVSVGGQIAPPPQRQVHEPPIQAMVEAAVHYEQDIKATTMVNDSKLGAKSNETSGAAINARKAQSDVSNYNYIDNRDHAIRNRTRMILDLIPRTYSTRAVMRIIGEDEQPMMVTTNNDPSRPAYSEEQIGPDDIKKIYNLSVGQYDVVMGVGPTYITRRQEGFDMLTKMVNSAPQLMSVIGDLIFENADIPGGKRIAKRLYNALPDNLKDADNTSIPPNVVAGFKKLQALNDQLTQQNHQLKNIIDQDIVKQRATLQVKQQEIDAKNHQTDTVAKTAEASISGTFMAAQLKIMADHMLGNIEAEREKDRMTLEHRFNLIEQTMQGVLGHVTAMAQMKQQAALEPAEPSTNGSGGA